MKVTLKEIATISAGQNAPQGDKNYCNDGKPFVKAGNLQELIGGGDIKKIQKVSHKVAEEYRLKLFQKGTILFAKSGMSCMKGLVYVLPQDSYVVNHLACITPNQNLSEYLKFYFLFNKPNRLIKDSAYPSISLTDISNIEIEIEENEKREKIVNQLNNLRCSIKLMNNIIAKYDDLVKARFVEMFENGNYQVEKLGTLCEKITDGTHKTPTYLEEGITFISAKNIVNGELDFTDIKHISEEEYEEIQKRCQIAIYDILLSKSGSLGSPVIVKTEEKLGLFESLAVIKYDRERLLPEFLCEQLKTDRIQRQFITGTKGVAIKHLHLGVIAAVGIIVPPLDKQKTFANFVKQVDKSKFIQMNSTI